MLVFNFGSSLYLFYLAFMQPDATPMVRFFTQVPHSAYKRHTTTHARPHAQQVVEMSSLIRRQRGARDGVAAVTREEDEGEARCVWRVNGYPCMVCVCMWHVRTSFCVSLSPLCLCGTNLAGFCAAMSCPLLPLRVVLQPPPPPPARFKQQNKNPMTQTSNFLVRV